MVGKIVKFVLIGLLFVIILGVVLFKFFGEKAIITGAETAGTKTLGVAVNIDGLGLGITSGSGTIKGLSIANPAGFNNPYLMQMQEGQVKVNIKSLMSDEIIIDKVYLDNLHITFEQKGFTSNVQVITDTLKSKSESADKPADTSEGEKSAKKVVISDFQIVNAKLSIKLLPLPGKADTVTIPLPDIKLTDVGKGEKMSFEQIVELVFVKITEAIAQVGSGVIPDDLLGSLKGSLSGAVDVIGKTGSNILESGSNVLKGGADAGKAAADSAAEAGKAITESATKTIENIGGIFGKKKTEEQPKE